MFQLLRQRLLVRFHFENLIEKNIFFTLLLAPQPAPKIPYLLSREKIDGSSSVIVI
jgi:hypothetical protein